MSLNDLPALNAVLNGISAVLLYLGWKAIRKKKKILHKKLMVSALISSSIFLSSYLVYHYNVGSIPYPFHDWTRPVYFMILIPHVILAGLMLPFIITGVFYAWKGIFTKHKKLMRWVWPVWMYVSVTGVVIYIMLYRINP